MFSLSSSHIITNHSTFILPTKINHIPKKVNEINADNCVSILPTNNSDSLVSKGDCYFIYSITSQLTCF